MKPIKSLLSLFAVLMVAVGAWGQAVTGITQPPAPSSPQCGGTSLTIAAGSVSISGGAGCQNIDVVAEIVDATTLTPISGTSVTLGKVSATPVPATDASLPLPASGGPYAVKYSTSGSGCTFASYSSVPGFMVTQTPVSSLQHIATTNPSTGPASSITLCQSAITGSTTLDFNAGCDVGSTVVKDAVTNATVVPGAPAPTAAGVYNYKISCVNGACSSPEKTVTLTVVATPSTPTGTIAFTTPEVCQTTAGPAVVLSLAAGAVCDNGSPKLYADNTTAGSGSASVVANTTTAGSFTYYVGCVTPEGCQTPAASRAPVVFKVNPLPAAAPTVSSFVSPGCVGTLPVFTATCGAGETAIIVNASSVEQTAIDFASVGTYTVYVACKTAKGCIGASSVPYTYNVVVPPTASLGQVSSVSPAKGPANSISLCVSAVSGSTVLSFNATCSTGGYSRTTDSSGNPVVSGTATAPTTPGTYTYNVYCKDGSCESTTPTTVTVNVIATPTAPTGTIEFVDKEVCKTTGLPNRTLVLASGVVCESGSPMIFNDNTTAGGGVATGSASTNTAGVFTYYIGCVTPEGCETPAASRVPVTLTVNPTAATPTVSSFVSPGCAGTLPVFTATCGAGETAIIVNASGVEQTASNFASVGSYTVYVACKTAKGCIGASSVPYTYNTVAAPTAISAQASSVSPAKGPASSLTFCASEVSGSTVLSFNATCSTGGYSRTTDSSGNPVVSGTATVPTTPGTYTYNVYCKDGSCEGTTPATVTVTVVGTPTAPTGTIEFVDKEVCQTAGLPNRTLVLASGVVCASGSPMIFNDNTTAGGGVATGSASTNTAGVFTYYVGCVTPEGCETPAASRVPVTLTVNAFPSAATVSITPTGSPVCSGVITLSVTSCAATDSVKIWDVTTGMTLLGAGKGTSFSVDITRTPATTTTYSFAARCISAKGCTNPAAPATAPVIVNPTIKTPVATIIDADNKTSRCQGEIQVALYFNTDCGALATLWYNTPTGGTPIASLTNVTPTAPAEYKYYASCKDLATGCESPIRAEVKYTVNPAGSTPTAVSMTAAGTTVNVSQDKVICSTTGTAIVFTGCPSGETLLVSVDSNPYSATLPTVMADGIKHNYRVRCQAGSGATACTGPESGVMSLTAYSVLTTAPTASVVPAVVCSASAPVAFGGSSNCGALATVWFDATTNTQLLSLPSMTPTTPGTYSYYAKCVNGGGCMSPASATTSLTVVGNSTAPTITSVGGTEVCTGVNVTLTTNCPSGSVVKWSTGDTGNALPLVSAVPQVRAVTAKCVITVGSTTCESPVSATTTVVWKTFDITIINIGSPLSGVKPGSNVPKSAWAANFVTVDAGPSLQSSSQGNPSVFFTENPNKGADRFWTVHVESCALGTAGAISYDMLVTPEAGAPYSYNTVENNAPYLMYANRDGFTELYAHNHGAYGFTSEPKYTQGLPKGLYKLSIRYWSEKGMGLYPAVRTAQGTQLAYQEYWFRIQSQNGIGSGAAREGVTENTEAPFVTMGQNPVTRTLSLTINGAKGQEVKLNLVDAAGRSIKVSSVTPETNTHREEIDMTSQNTGMYFIQVSTPSKRAALKVLKVSQD